MNDKYQFSPIDEDDVQSPIKVYKKRWLILFIYILYSAANSFQWMEYSIITNIIMKFYHVTASDVDWTSIIYMLVFPIIVVPVSYAIEKKGLRFAALVGGIGTALAAVTKLFSINENAFYVILIGQAIGSAAQVFVLSLPSKIAAVWFKPNEIATACALAVFGTQVGFALGFLVPTSLVRNNDDTNLIGRDLKMLCWALVIYMAPVILLIIFAFPKQPPKPPSLVQLEERTREVLNFKKYVENFTKLFTNRGFVYHWLAYGINVGVFATISTLLNQLILEYFPNAEKDAGRIGLMMIAAGAVGSLLFGIYLDKFHKYKETTMFVNYGAGFSVIVAMFSLLTCSKILVYITFTIVGFFTGSYIPIGFEFAVEITYPADECTTTGLLNGNTQAFGVIVTLISSNLISKFGSFWVLGCQAALLLLASIITSWIPNEKRRQDAINQSKLKKNNESGELLE